MERLGRVVCDKEERYFFLFPLIAIVSIEGTWAIFWGWLFFTFYFIFKKGKG